MGDDSDSDFSAFSDVDVDAVAAAGGGGGGDGGSGGGGSGGGSGGGGKQPPRDPRDEGGLGATHPGEDGASVPHDAPESPLPVKGACRNEWLSV
jgi:hypothetical protein